VTKEIVDAVKALEAEKGISADTLMDALEDALLSAYKKSPGAARYARVDIDHVNGDFIVYELLIPSDLEEELLDEAEALVPALGLAYDNPGLVLGAALGTSAAHGRDKLVIADNGSGLDGFGGWVEQLVAESTGKQGSGIVPVVVEDGENIKIKERSKKKLEVLILWIREIK